MSCANDQAAGGRVESAYAWLWWRLCYMRGRTLDSQEGGPRRFKHSDRRGAYWRSCMALCDGDRRMWRGACRIGKIANTLQIR